MNAELGIIVRNRRMKLHLSQVQLSKLSGVSQSAISDIENPNATRYPNADTLQKLAAALRCSVADLVGEDEKTPAVIDGGLDEGLVSLLLLLTPQELQRVQDFVSGLIASRTV